MEAVTVPRNGSKHLCEECIKETLAKLIHQDLERGTLRMGCIPDDMIGTIVNLSKLFRDYYTNPNWDVTNQGDLVRLVFGTISKDSAFHASLILKVAVCKELNDTRSFKELLGLLPGWTKKDYRGELKLIEKFYTEGTMAASVPCDVIIGSRDYPDNPFRPSWSGQTPVTFERIDELVYSVNSLIPPLRSPQYLVVIDRHYLEIWKCACTAGVGSQKLFRMTTTESHTAALIVRALFWFEFVRSQTKQVFEPKSTTVTEDEINSNRNNHSKLIYDHFCTVIHSMIRDDNAKKKSAYANTSWFKRLFVPEEDRPRIDVGRILNAHSGSEDIGSSSCGKQSKKITRKLIWKRKK